MIQPVVAILTPSADTSAGGVERFSQTLAALLSGRADVRLISPGGTPPARAARLGLQFQWMAAQVARSVREASPDLVISNGTLGAGVTGRRVHVFHGTMIESMRRSVRLHPRERLRGAMGGGLAEFRAARGADIAVAVSRSAAAEAAKYYRQPLPTVIENGIDTGLFCPGDKASARRKLGIKADGTPYALFAGRVEPRKGADVALAAASAAGFTLLVAGPTPLPGSVHLGRLAPQELAQAYTATDCVILPTHYEACSLVVLEALSCGTPIVTSPVGWIPDLLSHVPAYQAFIAQPEVPQLTRALAHVGSQGAAATVAQARSRILSDNSLEAFNRQWDKLLSQYLD